MLKRLLQLADGVAAGIGWVVILAALLAALGIADFAVVFHLGQPGAEEEVAPEPVVKMVRAAGAGGWA